MAVRRTLDLVQQFALSFHPRSLPPMLRATYSRELLAWMFLPIMLGAVEGGTMAVIVKKAFAGAPGVSDAWLDWAVATVTAAPTVANLTSFWWASLSSGRGKVRFISALQVATSVCVALIALAPWNAFGLALLVLLTLVARTTWTGVVTIRTAVWGANYPKADRARIAGKMATVQSIALALVGVLIGTAMDRDSGAFHWLFPMVATGGIVGTLIYRRVRLRGQRRLARAELDGRAGRRPSFSLVGIARVLAEDALYRKFMFWMFIFGLGNLMLQAPLAIVLVDGFAVGYRESILITAAIPAILMPLSIPAWSRLLDRRHVVEFRAVHAWSFVLASLLQVLGSAFGSLALFFAASVATGVAFGGGVLAWNLGHHDFAPAHRDSEYMGVHVTLTGVRGLIAPFLAVSIYRHFDQGVAGAAGAGVWVFGVCFALNVIGALGFVRMRRTLLAARAASGPAVAGHD
ncbi:MAG TPA: MFS transporter [Phycisphaerales bacterium]|nr:MFS transporter [Phycisphaerales bacterium]HMP36267.1 MFS transporter [Phycisphaerales bacterium]